MWELLQHDTIQAISKINVCVFNWLLSSFWMTTCMPLTKLPLITFCRYCSSLRFFFFFIHFLSVYLCLFSYLILLYFIRFSVCFMFFVSLFSAKRFLLQFRCCLLHFMFTTNAYLYSITKSNTSNHNQNQKKQQQYD